eukprot:CAMPEP_0117660396 /NCGR_PEP_ID=MMETSP0804-20121206/6945_1 /TAXON_ID=1074897 /ORGANISM="Tetraselmis astigmatica, Strain CCMP880" /LENGTH=207 /DNA_ID=CAMNT_0005467121 /DNA_START=349 /DNA_END=973 /DNA_ORIENTATION=-
MVPTGVPEQDVCLLGKLPLQFPPQVTGSTLLDIVQIELCVRLFAAFLEGLFHVWELPHTLDTTHKGEPVTLLWVQVKRAGKNLVQLTLEFSMLAVIYCSCRVVTSVSKRDVVDGGDLVEPVLKHRLENGLHEAPAVWAEGLAVETHDDLLFFGDLATVAAEGLGCLLDSPWQGDDLVEFTSRDANKALAYLEQNQGRHNGPNGPHLV